jgi:micrococcal nuclease
MATKVAPHVSVRLAAVCLLAVTLAGCGGTAGAQRAPAPAVTVLVSTPAPVVTATATVTAEPSSAPAAEAPPPSPEAPAGLVQLPAEEPAPAQQPEADEPWNRPGPDLDCKDIGHRVVIYPPDYHRLDADGDGIGCESY